MKACKKCGELRPLDDYYAHPTSSDGHDSKCKPCARRLATERRDANIEAVRAYDRERSKLPHRLALNKRNSARYRSANPLRYKCNTAVGNAIRDGRLVKSPCWICGSIDVEAHHPDYSAPLDVVWLCSAHHHEIHLKHPR